MAAHIKTIQDRNYAAKNGRRPAPNQPRPLQRSIQVATLGWVLVASETLFRLARDRLRVNVCARNARQRRPTRSGGGL
jgi:hypothetical protein